jgi:hypothetical protein
MSWAIGLWAGYAVLTVIAFGLVWCGLNYLQKSLLTSVDEETEE